MEFVILGLLMLRPQTMYDIKKTFEETITLFYSASFGSINTALSKLYEKHWVTLDAHVEDGRHKKTYTITQAGQTAFEAWLTSHIPSEKVKEPALTRLFFLGFLPAAERITVLEEHIASLRATADALAILHDQVEQRPIPDSYHDIALFQKLTLHYGKEYYAFSLGWFTQLLTTLKEDQR